MSRNIDFYGKNLEKQGKLQVKPQSDANIKR